MEIGAQKVEYVVWLHKDQSARLTHVNRMKGNPQWQLSITKDKPAFGDEKVSYHILFPKTIQLSEDAIATANEVLDKEIE